MEMTVGNEQQETQDLLFTFNSSFHWNMSVLNISYEEDLGVSEISFSEDLKILVQIVPFLVPVLFSFIIILGFIGNLLVVFVVLLNKNMRNTTNLLILNLAVREAVKKEKKTSMEFSIPVRTPASQAEIWKKNKIKKIYCRFLIFRHCKIFCI